jgi:MFS family permease
MERLQQQSKKKNSQLALLGAAHSLNHSLSVIAPPLLTLIMSDLGVSKFVIGTVATVASLLYGVGALIGGPLGDRIGEAKTIAICLAFSGLSTFIMLAAGFTSSIYVYALALISMAVWASLYHPTANSLISKTFKGRVSEAMGLHGVGGTLGTVLTPIVAWFIGATFGWPWAFVTFGVLSVILALFFVRGDMRVRLASLFSCFLTFSFFCYELMQYNLFTTITLAWLFAFCFILFLRLEKRTRRIIAKENTYNGSRGTIVDALKIRELWILLIFNVAIGLFMKGVELYFPTYLQDNKLISFGLTKEERGMWASIAFTLVLAVGVPAQWIGGKTADKIGSKKVLIATSTGVCISLLSLLLFPVGIIGIALFIVLYGLSFYAHQPALNSLTGFCCPQNQRGAVYGIFFFTSFGIGSLSQSIAGYIADHYGGLDTAFYMLTAFALAALLLSLKLPERKESNT